MNEVVRNSTADLMDAETGIDTKVLTQEQFEQLCVSNDWGLDVIEELEAKGYYIPKTKPYIVPTEEVIKKFHIKKGT